MSKDNTGSATSVKYAILALLSKRASYPYELANMFQARIGDAWQLNRGQVYQIVYNLDEEGLAERTEVKNRHNPHGIKCYYQITDRGLEVLKRWRKRGAKRMKPLRDDLLLRIAIATCEDVGHLLREIDRRERECAERLLDYTSIEAAQTAIEEAMCLDEVGSALSTKAVLGKLNLELDLLNEARNALSRVEAAQVSAQAQGRAG